MSQGRLFIRLSVLVALLLVAGSWLFIVRDQPDRMGALFTARTVENALGFLQGLAGVGEEVPAYRDPQSWRNALELIGETLIMSILATGFAGVGTLLTVIPAARSAADGRLTLSRGPLSWGLFYFIRGVYILTRALPELVWAMLIIFIFSPGILPGAIALGLHNFGILGKLCAEVVEDLDLRPARAVRSAGARTSQMLFYAILPAVLPQFVTYLLYRWEVIIRTTIVVGFVSAGGLGREFRLSMSWFHLSDVALLLACYVLMVVAVDLISGGMRRLAR